MAECRVCKVLIDKEANDWIMPVTNYYYHKKCYEDWKKSIPTEDEEYKDYIYDFISRDLKASYDYFMCEAQRKKFLKDNMTNKGIFFALKYFYDIKHNTWDKSHGGIGIVPYIYTESCTYWVNRERQSAGIVAEIENQMRKAANRSKINIKKKEFKSKKYIVDFSVLDDLEDEE